jgi:hypothetical protein
VRNFFSSVPAGEPPRNMDYAFWIRTAIRWLFEKKRSGRTWPEAIGAYNPRSLGYPDGVIARAGGCCRAGGWARIRSRQDLGQARPWKPAESPADTQ